MARLLVVPDPARECTWSGSYELSFFWYDHGQKKERDKPKLPLLCLPLSYSEQTSIRLGLLYSHGRRITSASHIFGGCAQRSTLPLEHSARNRNAKRPPRRAGIFRCSAQGRGSLLDAGAAGGIARGHGLVVAGEEDLILLGRQVRAGGRWNFLLFTLPM